MAELGRIPIPLNRHSRESGNPGQELYRSPLDPRFRGGDEVTEAIQRNNSRLRSRMSDKTLFSIGYEKARLGDVVAALLAAGLATLIDVRDRPQSRRPGFCKRPPAARLGGG